MAEVAQNEKLCLSNYAKKHVRYGTMANSMRREKYIKHTVQPGDTLQGLALRYGVSMEQVKRANKMWTTDSLFLRSTLDIPIFAESLTVSSISSASQSPQVSPVRKNEQNGENNLDSSNDLLNQLSSGVNDGCKEGALGSEESAADFLIRIDSHIALSKDKVLKLQKKVVYSEDDLHNSRVGLPQLGYQSHRSNLTGSSSLSDLSTDLSLPPQPVVMTKGRKVRLSLKKLEKQQDEIFEL